MIITIEEIKRYFFDLGKYKTIDVDKYAKDLIKQKADVSLLKPFILDFGTAHRIFFQVSLSLINNLEQQLDFIESNIDLLKEWWHVDQLLQFLKNSNEYNLIFERSSKYVTSELPFERRLGYVILLLGLQKRKDFFDKIASLFKDDDEYYVQMAEAWLIADLCIYNPEETIIFIRDSGLKYNILGKAIQKIQDSFRIDDDIKKRCKELRVIVRNN